MDGIDEYGRQALLARVRADAAAVQKRVNIPRESIQLFLGDAVRHCDHSLKERLVLASTPRSHRVRNTCRAAIGEGAALRGPVLRGSLSCHHRASA